jgi:hypothetical protein
MTNTGIEGLADLHELASLDIRYSRVTSGGRGIAVHRSRLLHRVRRHLRFRTDRRQTARPRVRADHRRLVISPGGKAMFSNGHLREISLARARIGDRELAALEPLPAREALNLEATDSSPRFAT